MRLNGLIVGLAVAACPLAARGQSIFSGGATGFAAEVRVINSGALLDAQAVVSHDQRYVTINAQPSASTLLALRQFPIGVPTNLGFVGGAGIQTLAAGHPVPPTPSPLDHPGITKLD